MYAASKTLEELFAAAGRVAAAFNETQTVYCYHLADGKMFLLYMHGAMMMQTDTVKEQILPTVQGVTIINQIL